MRIVFAFSALFSALVLVGCTNATKSGPGTGPGGVGKTASTVEYDVFPTEIIVLKPGDTKDVKVSRKGKDMKDSDFTVTSSDPKVKVEGGKFKGDAKDATVTIKADPDAPAKEHTITITAGDVTKTVHVRVDAGNGVVGGKKDLAPEKKGSPADTKK